MKTYSKEQVIDAYEEAIEHLISIEALEVNDINDVMIALEMILDEIGDDKDYA